MKQLGDSLYVTEQGGALHVLSADSRPAVRGVMSGGLTGIPRIMGTDPTGFLYIKDQEWDYFSRVDVRDATHLSVVEEFELTPSYAANGFGAVSGAYAYVVTPSYDDLRVIRIH